MEEIDISSVETSPRTDDSVVVYRYGCVIEEEDTPRQYVSNELLNEPSHRSNTTNGVNDKVETSDGEVDVIESSDRFQTIHGNNETLANKENSNICDIKKIFQGNLTDTNRSFLNDTIISESIKDFKFKYEDSFGSIDTIDDSDSFDKEVPSEIKQKSLTTSDSEPVENGNEQILSVHSSVIYPVQFKSGNTFFTWNMEPINDISDVEYTGRYVPSLGYRPLKNVIDVAPNINSEPSIDSTRERGRIKRPWFYEITIEEEDGHIEEENDNNLEDENKVRYIPPVDLTHRDSEIIYPEKFNQNLFNNTEVEHLKLDRDKIDSSVNLKLEPDSKFNDDVKVKATDLSEIPSKSLRGDSKPLSENRDEVFKDKFDKTEPNISNESDIHKPKGNNILDIETRIDPTNIGIFKSDNDQKKLSADNKKKCRSDETHKCKIGKSRLNVELKDNLINDLDKRKTLLENDRLHEKHKINVELSLNAGSSGSSYSNLTSITPHSLCQVCGKKASESSSSVSSRWKIENPDAIRRQEENILRHLELIRLGRLLLENPSEFFRKKSGKRKNSLFNNRKNMSFSNDRLRDIEWANKILLQKLVSTSKRKQKL